MSWDTPLDISFFVVKVKDWRQWHPFPKPQIGHLAPILSILTAVQTCHATHGQPHRPPPYRGPCHTRTQTMARAHSVSVDRDRINNLPSRQSRALRCQVAGLGRRKRARLRYGKARPVFP
jgi:hypothetical protein